MAYLLPALQHQFKHVDLNGHVTECKCASLNDRAIFIVDILKVLPPMTLDKACQQFDLEVKKQKFDILFKDWDAVTGAIDRITEYCIYDCVSSYLLIERLQLTFL